MAGGVGVWGHDCGERTADTISQQCLPSPSQFRRAVVPEPDCGSDRVGLDRTQSRRNSSVRCNFIRKDWSVSVRTGPCQYELVCIHADVVRIRTAVVRIRTD
jgi:hypothetical protein